MGRELRKNDSRMFRDKTCMGKGPIQGQKDSKTPFQVENSRPWGDKENIIEKEDLKAPKDLEDTFVFTHTHTHTHRSSMYSWLVVKEWEKKAFEVYVYQ